MFNKANPQPYILVTLVKIGLRLRLVLIEAAVETSRQVILETLAVGVAVQRAEVPEPRLVPDQLKKIGLLIWMDL